MTSLPTAITTTATAGGAVGNLKPSITFELPLPPALSAPTGTPASTPVNVTVLATSKGVTTLALPDGTQFTARLHPPLPSGSQLQFTPPTVPAGVTSVTVPPQTVTLLKLATPAPGQPAPTSSGSIATANPTPSVTGPVGVAPLTATTAPALTVPPGNLPVMQPQLAAGPVQLLLNTSSLTPQTVTAVVTGQPDASGNQPVTLTSATGTPLGTARLAAGPALPGGTSLPLHVLPQGLATSTTPAAARPALLLQPVPLAPLPSTPASATPAPIPVTLPSLSQLHILPATPQALPPGLTVARVLPQATALPTPSAQTTPQPPTIPGQTLLLGNGHTATLQSPLPLPAGTLLMLTVTPTRITVTQATTPAPPASPYPATASGTPAAAAAPTAVTSLAQLPPGTQLSGTVTAPPASGQVTLMVTSPGPLQNQPVTLSLPASLATPSALPQGTQLTVQLQPGGQAAIVSTVLPEAATRAQSITTALTSLGQSWGNLNQLLQTLPSVAGLLPQLGQALTAKLPQLNALLPTLLPYADAVAANNPAQTFTSEAVTLARTLGLDLERDINNINQLQQQPQTQLQNISATQPQQNTPTEPWRGLLFPYQEAPGQPTKQAHFFWRRQHNQTSDDTTPPNLRFVVELDLSRFGPLQLDGLMQTAPGSAPNLWLKLRTLQPVPEATMATQLQTLVSETLRNYGLSGGITLEHTARFPIDPSAELLAQASPDRASTGTLA